MEVMNVTEEDENLPEVVEEEALICYFCIWQAEFGDESGDEAVAWWPKNLDLEENARVLLGDVEQCWVQLDEIDLAKYEKEIPKKRKYGSSVCLYCGNRYDRLMEHVKRMHKEAIKCGIRGCTTYFQTEEEKEQHMQHVFHANQCEINLWKMHMNHSHPEQVACSHYGCNEYFKSKSKMVLHVNSIHKQINQDIFQCKHCEYFTTVEYNLRNHEQSRHKPKIFKCDRCDAKFGAEWIVKKHFKQCHTFDKCNSCGQEVSVMMIALHRKPSVCSKYIGVSRLAAAASASSSALDFLKSIRRAANKPILVAKSVENSSPCLAS
ncbi:zinc finger protein OZF-like [Cloeon dipterum]|uniref:zinc finger protein OZF-like n=1 Tax=Cloeon dipterum TaxID=197152 RepID=UPI003220026B